MENGIFIDRRQEGGRRYNNNKGAIPKSGCRRVAERRATGAFDAKPWWLKTNYAEHLLSPKLIILNKHKGNKNNLMPTGKRTQKDISVKNKK